jgi:predicted lysophospholipase L1 biosynthesis ABC-type transport system permease subunit
MYIAFLVAHIISGFTCLVTGIIAALAPKRRGRHTRFGEVYHVSYVVVAVSAIVMSIMHWSSSAYLFYIAIFSYGFAILGYLARKIRWKDWLSWHIIGMIGSYIGIVTGTLVVNSPHIPYLNKIPALVYWFLPTIIGTPIIIRTVNRYKPRKPNVRSTPMV